MANKKQQAQKRRQAQHRQQHNVQKSHERDQHREHLPKTGTDADHEYLMRRSREDLVDFGLGGKKTGLLIVIGLLVTVAVIMFIVLVAVYS